MNQPYNAVFNSVPAANALRRVEGFNPLKFLRRLRSEQTGAEVLKLELPYQKLWFRLAFPNGRMVLNNLRITDQLARAEGVTEDLKARNQLEWIRAMNSCRARAEEIAVRELILS